MLIPKGSCLLLNPYGGPVTDKSPYLNTNLKITSPGRLESNIKNQNQKSAPTSSGFHSLYLNVPTALVFVVGSTTHTATELGTFVLVTDETEFGFT